MKYFSIQDWKTWEPWDQIQGNRKRYQEYAQAIRPQLPRDLRLLCDFSPEGNPQRVFLNDSQVSQITSDFETRTVTLVLEGEYTDKDNRQLGLRRFFLNYQGVTGFRIEANQEDAYQVGPGGDQPEVTSATVEFDDHGWDEIELIEEACLSIGCSLPAGQRLLFVFVTLRLTMRILPINLHRFDFHIFFIEDDYNVSSSTETLGGAVFTGNRCACPPIQCQSCV